MLEAFSQMHSGKYTYLAAFEGFCIRFVHLQPAISQQGRCNQSFLLRTGKVGGGTQALSPPQRKSLERQQIAEFRRRYGPTLKIDRRSELLLCKSVRGEIMGCAGVEVDYISRPDGGDRVSAPLMSNVAVGRKFRRRGIAEDLVKRTEELVRKQWGYKECFLYVEKRNIAAVQLYRKMGYRKLWQVDDAKTCKSSRLAIK